MASPRSVTFMLAVTGAAIAAGWSVGAVGPASVASPIPIGELEPAVRGGQPIDPAASLVYSNDFSTAADGDRLDQFVAYRDPFVVNHTSGASDHAPAGGIGCTGPSQTRPQTRVNPAAHVYQCLPAGDAALGHQMAYAMDTSGYGFVGALPDQVFDGAREVSVDVNTTSAGGRNFVEIKVVPADRVFVNGMPCIPDLPCNDGWDYDDLGAVGAGTDSQEGTGLTIATAAVPDGHQFDLYDRVDLADGDRLYRPCSGDDFCFSVGTHVGNPDVRDRFRHTLRDNGDGTLSFGVESADGSTDWVTAAGAFPGGPVRVVIAFHNYTGTKSGNGPGFDDNDSASTGGFTWHWDDLRVVATSATPSLDHYGGTDAARIVTPNGCVAFSQGQRSVTGNTDVAPRFHCDDDPDLDL